MNLLFENRQHHRINIKDAISPSHQMKLHPFTYRFLDNHQHGIHSMKRFDIISWI